MHRQKLLLADQRVAPAANNNKAIREASRYGQTKVVRLLLKDSRVDPSDKNNDAIGWASRYGQSKIVRLLLLDHRVNTSNEAIQEASEKRTC